MFRAVQALKRQGCLETVKGSGTFVVRDLQKHLEKKLLIYIFDKPECRQLNPGDSLRYTCFQRTIRKSGFMDLALQEDDVLEPEEMNEVAGALITLTVVLFVVGGGSWAEYEELRQHFAQAKTAAPGTLETRVVYGATEMLTAEQFLAAAAHLR